VYVGLPVDRKGFPGLLMKWGEVRLCASDQRQDIRYVVSEQAVGGSRIGRISDFWRD